MISENFYLPQMLKQETKIIKTCVVYQFNKIYKQSTQAFTQPILVQKPLDLVSINFLGPLPSSQGNFKYLLVCVDVFSKFFTLYKLRAPKTTR